VRYRLVISHLCCEQFLPPYRDKKRRPGKTFGRLLEFTCLVEIFCAFFKQVGYLYFSVIMLQL